MLMKKEHKDKILGVLKVLFPEAKIYVFGSRARGTHVTSSDIDIAIDVGKKMNFSRIGEAKDALEALYVPYKIDLVDFHRAPQEMREMILKEGILWKS